MEQKLSKQEIKYQKMTTEAIPKLVCTLAVPTIISMLISSIYNLTDTFFVGRINTQATAAVGIVFSVMALIQACGFFFGHGAGIFISRKLGCREIDSANQMGTVGLFSAFLFGVFAAAAGIIFLEPLAVLLGSTPTVLPYTIAYLRLTLLGAPFMTMSLVLNNMLRYQGNAMYGMVGMVAGAVINIGLDPLFIFVLDMGVAGAALATVVSQFISFILLLVMNEKSGGIKISFRYFKPSASFFGEMARGGVPSLLRQGLASVAVVFLNNAAAIYGDSTIAAMSIVGRVMFFCGAIMIGFGQGFQPVCAFNYGAKLFGRVKEAFSFCNKVLLIFMIFMAVIFAVFATEIVTVFRREDAEVIAVGARVLRFQSIAMPLGGFIALSNMMLQVMGRAARASIIASARQGLFFIPLILIMPGIFGLNGLLLTQMVADILTFAVALPLTIGVLKELE